jgi:HAD superfamily phosphoserine phosphatase-like hydrolase
MLNTLIIVMKKIICALRLPLLVLSLCGCSSGSKTGAELKALNWDSFNKSRIEQTINAHGKHSAGYSPDRPPYAVFDWDNTSIFLDIQEAVLAFQLKNLVFGATPEVLQEAIQKNIGQEDFAPEYNNLAGESVNIERISADIIESYTVLYREYKGLAGSKSLEEVAMSPHYATFIAKTRYLYEAIGGTFDHSISYPWVTYMFAGMTGSEVRRLTRETVRWQLTQPVETVRWESPESLPGKAGRVAVTWKNGLRTVPEMQDLYRLLREHGFDVMICSASFVDAVKEISSNPDFGYNNPDSHVFAMELERDGEGKIRVRFREGYDRTQGEGKTATIKRFLESKYGRGPVIVAGDSEGDQNMMQDFDDTELVLIINRLRSSDIGKFSKIALETRGTPHAKYLLQGRNDNTGTFVASPASYPYGSTEAKTLK